jgi:soluble P-type ATPase
MIEAEIPGRAPLMIAHLVLDVNGTLALDGALLPGVRERLALLDDYVELHLLTADTHGRQAEIDAALGIQATIIQGSVDKGAYVLALGAESVAVVGNGANDSTMFDAAALRIAVLGPEGLAASLLKSSDVLVRDINEGLDLLLNPRRLVATLRR